MRELEKYTNEIIGQSHMFKDLDLPNFESAKLYQQLLVNFKLMSKN